MKINKINYFLKNILLISFVALFIYVPSYAEDDIPPAKISNLTALSGINDGEINLTWTAPGDDGTTGTAATYIIRYNTVPMNDVFSNSGGSGWSWRKEITITNGGSALTDYQVLIVTDTAVLISEEKMKNDCSDIRFTDSDGITELSFWIESGTNTQTTRIWVKVPNVPSGAKTIYMYYGNPNSGTGSSNIGNTFIFGDEFDGTSIDTGKWNIGSDNTFSVTGGKLKGTNTGTVTTGRIKTIQTFSGSTPFMLESYIMAVTIANDTHVTLGLRAATTDCFGIVPSPLGDPTKYWYRRNGTWVWACNTGNLFYGWHTERITASGSNNVEIYVNRSDTSETDTRIDTNEITNEPITLGKRYDDAYLYNNESYECYWEWIYVRKYASVVPTTVMGTEESAGSGNWNNSINVYNEPEPQEAGTSESYTVTGLTRGTTYYFALKTVDDRPNTSDISNMPYTIPTDKVPPSQITTISALTGTYPGEINLTWTAPGNDIWERTLGLGSKFIIQSSSWTEVVWSTTNALITISTSNVPPLSIQNYIVTGLSEDVTYYFRIWTVDEWNNHSSISNGATAQAQVTIISIYVSDTIYDYGGIPANSINISTEAVIVINNGNVKETYSIKCSSSSRWSLGSSPGADTFSIQSAFHSSEPTAGNFENQDILTDALQQCTTAVFSIDGTHNGKEVPVNAQRKLWLSLKTPLSTSTTAQQEMSITITAGSP